MESETPMNFYDTLNNKRQLNPKLFEEVVLFDSSITPQQREVIESLSEIYSIIIAMDQVEKAYLKDEISNSEYTSSVTKLLAQYKAYLTTNEEVEKEFYTLQNFKEKWNISASNAITRIERGIPVTVEHGIQDITPDANSVNASSGSKFSAKSVAEATGNFITVMDALKLNYRAKDQLHPLMSELLLSINRVTPQDFENRTKLVNWIVTINKMKVNDSLTEEQARELLFELDGAYKSFYLLLA